LARPEAVRLLSAGAQLYFANYPPRTVFHGKVRLYLTKDASGPAVRRDPVLSHPRRFILREHRYSVGQSVYFTSGPYGRATTAAKGAYKIVRLLPSEGEDREYRIKSPSEPHERVAKESQLDRDF